jgi:hypothetical protein
LSIVVKQILLSESHFLIGCWKKLYSDWISWSFLVLEFLVVGCPVLWPCLGNCCLWGLGG